MHRQPLQIHQDKTPRTQNARDRRAGAKFDSRPAPKNKREMVAGDGHNSGVAVGVARRRETVVDGSASFNAERCAGGKAAV